MPDRLDFSRIIPGIACSASRILFPASPQTAISDHRRALRCKTVNRDDDYPTSRRTCERQVAVTAGGPVHGLPLREVRVPSDKATDIIIHVSAEADRDAR